MQCAKNKARLQAAIDFAESEEFFKIKKSRGRRYTMDDSIFALSLMKYSPKAYKLLRRTFALSSRRTLMALLAHLPMHCGINENLIRSLGESVQKMDPIDKHCVLYLTRCLWSHPFVIVRNETVLMDSNIVGK
ncbi:Transposase protein [Popillia japonica]|uniref:Transposase protein n=1 Tax=Popillia japonica TaxID=7064 RepID=A0AAW1N480_POPJA